MTILYNHEKVRGVNDWESVLRLFLRPNRARLGARVVELLLKPENRKYGLTMPEILEHFPNKKEAKVVQRLIYAQGHGFRYGGRTSNEHDLLRLGIITNRGVKMLRTGRWTYSDQFAGSLKLLSDKIKRLAKDEAGEASKASYEK